MDEHAKISEEIFSAAHSEFKSLDFFTSTIVYMKVYGKITEEEVKALKVLTKF